MTSVVSEPGRSMVDVVGTGVRETMLSLPDVLRTDVLCTEDNIIPPATQREMAARLGVEPIEIASDHAVFIHQPRELAAVLAR